MKEKENNYEQRTKNKEYQFLLSITDRTALRDLDDLISKELVQKRGAKKGTHYLLKYVG